MSWQEELIKMFVGEAEYLTYSEALDLALERDERAAEELEGDFND